MIVSGWWFATLLHRRKIIFGALSINATCGTAAKSLDGSTKSRTRPEATAFQLILAGRLLSAPPTDQAVDLGNNQRGSVKPRSGERLLQSGPISALARLDLGVLIDDLPVTTIELGLHSFALGLQAEPALARLPVETR
jgi:hypothetical protein